jgi:hypothetical protein
VYGDVEMNRSDAQREAVTPRSILVFCVVGMIVSTAAAQTTATWTLRELAVIGSINDAANALSRIGTVVIGPPDHIFVSQPQESFVRVFDSRGRLLRIIGRPGEGPGEFRSISSIGLLDGNLYVTDNNQKRVSWFSTSGSFLRSKARMSAGIRRAGIAYLPTAPQTLLPAGRAVAMPGTATRYVIGRREGELDRN